MAEYIERAVAFDAITDLAGKAPTRSAYEAVWKSARVLKKIPAADVVPVVHGWWNADETCSLCGEKSTEGLDATKWDYWLPNYCPHCGARMDGGAIDG